MLLITTTRRRRERDDVLWTDGYLFGEAETDEAIADKDAFIGEQAELIQELIKVDGAIDWAKVPTALQSRLADYV